MARLAGLAAWVLALALPARAADPPVLSYRIAYDVRVVPTERTAHVELRLDDPSYAVRVVRFEIDPARHQEFAGDGPIETSGDTVAWRPRRGGAALRWRFRIDHLRDERSYDARCAKSWAIFRGEDMVPTSTVRAEQGSSSRATLRLRLPNGWATATPFERDGDVFRIDQPHRRFDRPSGWIAVGNLGVMREHVAGAQVSVAAPRGHGFRRLDTLALLRWTLPELREIVGQLPPRLLVVGAGDPMWRGGLSGPASLFLHARRPLIADDGTSPVVHELVHAVLRLRSGGDADWVVEGLAELYSLELLRRSGTIGKRRYEKSLARLSALAKDAGPLRTDRSTGATTAAAVVALRALDAELREASAGARSLDDVVRALHAGGPATITTDGFRAVAERVAGRPLEAFFRRYAAR
jgi:hypothetical protein